jgi:hypothetical protein
MQGGIAAELDLRPLQTGDLGRPQAVPERNQDQRRIAVTVAARLCRLDELLDLGDRQIFPRAPVGIARARRHDPGNY